MKSLWDRIDAESTYHEMYTVLIDIGTEMYAVSVYIVDGNNKEPSACITDLSPFTASIAFNLKNA